MNFLTLDVGTTCCKCQLFSESGEILAYKSEEYPLIGREGEEYVDIEGIFARVKEMMRFAAANGGFSSMCISTFGESFVLLDKNDKAVFLPMLYTDPRGAAEAEEIGKYYDDNFGDKLPKEIRENLEILKKNCAE